MRSFVLAGALGLIVLMTACGGPGTGTPGGVDGFVASLPSWSTVSPPGQENNGVDTGDPPVTEQLDDGGVLYTCTTKHYSITKNPKELAFATPDPDVMWPGALVQGASHLNGLGSLLPLVVDKTRRAPLSISITGGGVLGISGGVSDTVDQPAPSTVREAINQLVVNAINSNVATGAGYSTFESSETFSSKQAALSVGFSARYMGAKMQADLDASSSASKHVYTASFIQRLFTVAMDPPQNPSGVFAPDVTAAELQQLGVSASNLPLYVSSVSYGRILIFSMTSTASKKRIEAALKFAYDGKVAAGSAYGEADLRQTLENSTVKVVAIGGPNTGVEALIQSADLKSYFESSLEINQVEPISLVVKNLADKTVATVANTTDYDARECVPAVALPTPDFWWRGEGSYDLEPNALGANAIRNSITYGAGVYGQAFSLDTNSYVASNLQTAASNYEPVYLLGTTGAFAVSAWVNPRMTSGYGTIIAEIGPSSRAGNFSLGVWNTGEVSFHRRPLDYDTAVDGVSTGASQAPANQWTFVTAVYGASPGRPDLRIYINGEYKSGGIYAGSIPTTYSEGRTRVGIRGYDSNVVSYYPYKGYIDEVMMFDHALTDDEVRSMYQNFDKMIP